MPADAPAVSYRPGSWMAVVAADMWLLVDAAPGEPLLGRAWEIAGRADGIGEIERLVRAEVATRPRHLLLAVADGDGLIVLLAGEGTAEVGPGPAGEMRCPTGVSIAEYRLARRPSHMVLRGGRPSEDASLPLGSGLVRAAEVGLDWAAREEDKGQPLAAFAPAFPAAPVADDPGVTLLPPAIEELTGVGAGPDEAGTGDVGTEDPRPHRPDAVPLAVAAADEVDDGYDHLFGRTVSRTVEEAAVRGDEPVAAAADPPTDSPTVVAQPEIGAPTGGAPAVAAPAPEPAVPVSALSRSVVRASTSGLIDAVPWTVQGDPTAPPAPAPSGPVSPPAELGAAAPLDADEVGLTVSRSAQKALLDQLADLPANPGGPSVHAVRCPAGHPNPAHAGTCRICGSAIDEQPPVTVPRPVLGRLRLSTGDEVSLDRGVLMGRGPTEGRQVGGERPHLVKLPSPGHDISRTHLEVRLDGWHVLVTDLNSTNGTLVTRPGRLPERLRPDQPTMIEPGTVVSLADDVTFTFEVA